MRSSQWLALGRALTLVAICASAALAVHYNAPSGGAFCGLDGGCESVRGAAYQLLGPQVRYIPAFGIVAYAGRLGLSFVTKTGFRHSAMLGGTIGLGLLMAQLRIGAFCYLCAIVDTAAILLAASAVALRRAENAESAGPSAATDADRAASQAPSKVTATDYLASWGWAGLALIAFATPFVWSEHKPAPPVPAAIQALYQPGKINVIEFADFQCPHCRRFHSVLKTVIADYRDKVHFERRHMPLSMHDLARPAARAAVCAAKFGKKEEAADWLFKNELEVDSPRKLGRAMKFPSLPYLACLEAPETDQIIDADMALIKSIGFVGLPTTYLGGKRFIGGRPEVELRAAFEKSKHGNDTSGIPAPAFVVFALAAAFGVGAFSWQRNTRPLS